MERNSHLTESELALYVDGLRLSRLDALPGKLREHVQYCLECKRAIMEIAAAVPESAYRPGVPHAYLDARARRARWVRGSVSLVRLAAGIIFLLGVGILILFIARNKAAVESEAPQVTVSQPKATDGSGGFAGAGEGAPLAMAGSFKPSPLYDRLTIQELRSAGRLTHLPLNGDTISAGQLFSWSNSTGTQPFTFTVLDNRGREAIQATVKGESYRLNEKLPSGLYYWKVDKAGELVFVAKFYVVR